MYCVTCKDREYMNLDYDFQHVCVMFPAAKGLLTRVLLQGQGGGCGAAAGQTGPGSGGGADRGGQPSRVPGRDGTAAAGEDGSCGGAPSDPC